jgi:hypothetical protein
MSKWLRFCRKGLTFGVACGLAMIAFVGQTARAGPIQITLHEAGKTDVLINLGSGLEGAGTDFNHVNADTNALNTQLDTNGFDFHFNSLGAFANSPGVGGLSTLFLTGQLIRVTTSGGDKTIQIDASQNGYTTNAVLSGVLQNSATGNFTSAPAGNNQLSTSYYNTNNLLDNTTGANSSTTLTFTSTGPSPNAHPQGGEPGSSPPLSVPVAPSGFSLTSRAVITLSQDVSVPPGSAQPNDQFTISTTVQTVPEPASIALMGAGLPIAILGLGWLRRRKASA